MTANVDDIMRRTRQYWYDDGLVELLFGIFFVAIGILLLADWATPADVPWKWIWTPSFMVLTIVAVLVGRPVINGLKERITYPRTGYVAYRRPRGPARRRRALIAGIVAAAVSMALVAILAYRQEFGRVVPLLMGIGVALLLLRFGSYTGLPRFYVLSGLSLGTGIVLALLSEDISLTVALYYALLGPAVIISGGYTLFRYLHAAPPEVGNDA